MKTGRIIKSTGSRYLADIGDSQHLECIIRGKLRLKGVKTTNPLAVGDVVDIEVDSKNENGIITHIHQRKNYIIRKSSNLSKQYHIIASNIDLALLMVTIKNPETPTEFIDRFLVTAEAYSIPVIILFNKTDIYNEDEIQLMKELIQVYSDVGYDAMDISLIEKKNLDVLKSKIWKKTSLISGNSGVGKSTLINYLRPELNLKVNEISEAHKTGKHTTTFAEMFEIDGNTYIIDTPGIKGFGLIDFGTEELYHYFPEFFKIAETCKYNNCLHVNEPGCAVKEAVEQGKVYWQRYRNYINMLSIENEKYRVM